MADISYTRTTWADGSEGGTPIDATKLNNIEQGIVDAVGAIGPNDTTADGTLKAQIDALGESVNHEVLYNSSGSNQTITLSDSAANYERMVIFYKNNDGNCSSVEVRSPNEKAVSLQTTQVFTWSSALVKSSTVYIYGTSISVTNYGSYSIANSTCSVDTSTNDIYITRVEAWR